MSIVNSRAGQKTTRPLLIRGGGIVSMDPTIGDLLTGDVHVRDGLIVAVGEKLDVPDAEIIDASAMIVMPGFVDSHRHLWEGAIRNALPSEDLNGYFMTVNKGFALGYEPDDVYLGTLMSCIGALDAGITTIFDWAQIQISPDHTHASIAALRESGIRAVFGYGPPDATDRGSEWPQGLLRIQKEEFSSADQLLTLALAGYSPEHAPYEMAKQLFQLARDAGVIMSVHSGLNGVGEKNQLERFGHEGLLGPDVNLIHCNTLSPTEWKMIADSGTSVSITASTEMQMGQGVPPIQPARDVGVKPSLGVDVETSVPNDLWTQMRKVFALQRSNALELHFAGKRAPVMAEVADMLEYATICGAVACRLDSKVGSLTPGKQADIVLLRADMLNVAPVNDLKSAVVLNMDARNVDTVMVAGRIVKRDGKMLGVDTKQLLTRIYASRDRVYAAYAKECKSPVHRM